MRYWKKYYYSYLDGLINFLVPPTKKVCKINGQNLPDGNFDYIVAPDILTRVYDVQTFLSEARSRINPHGRLIITQFNVLWWPILRLATRVRLRRKVQDPNWLNIKDIQNLAHLAGWEIVNAGTKMLVPIYIPIISYIFNYYLAQFWPFSRLGLFHYLLLRPTGEIPYQTAPSISIIIPARNEAGTIEIMVQTIPNLGSFTELIFIEGHSSDNTLFEIERVAKKYSQTKKISYAVQRGKGKGDAVRLGFDMAKGDILAIYDADMTVPPEEINKFYSALIQNKADFANGSRLIYPMNKKSMRFLNFIGNKFFSFAFTWILGQSIKDTLCGTKVLWRKDYELIKKNRTFFGDFDPFGDFDLILGATKLNLKIMDIPVHYRERVYGLTNISRFRHGWLLLKMTNFAMKKIKFI